MANEDLLTHHAGFEPPPASPTDSSGQDRVVVRTAHGLLKFRPTTQAAAFGVLTLLSLALAAFCMAMIWMDKGGAWPYATTTFIVGLYCPQPQIKKTDEQPRPQRVLQV